jgi:hypothetical protein
MFEPENDIERMLLRAAEPAERSSFVRALMDTEIFLVRIPEGGKVTRGPDGHAVIPEGVKLMMPTATRGEENLVPFFSAPSRARAWFPGDHLIAPELTRSLFGRYPNASFVLNPNSDCGKYFTPVEVRRLLAGQFEEGVHTVNAEAGEEILLAYPRETPGALIAALGRELGAVNSVRGGLADGGVACHRA